MTSTIATSPILGPLRPGELDSWEVPLTGQRTYNIYVQAHEPGVDFDLSVYDENGILIDLDERVSSSAYCSIIPYYTQIVTIEIECVRGFSTYQIAIEEESKRKRVLGLF